MFTPDGKRIVTASRDYTARIWDVATGQAIGEPLRGHQGNVWGAAFSPDGKCIVTASADTTARIWDAATGKPIGEPLRGHEGAVLSAAFSPDGKRILTASHDRTAQLWDVESGQTISEPLEGLSSARSAQTASESSPRLSTRRRGSGRSSPTPKHWCRPPRPPYRAASHPRSARPSSCRQSRRTGVSRWRNGPTTHSHGENGS
jgi:WD40 repeat protein